MVTEVLLHAVLHLSEDTAAKGNFWCCSFIMNLLQPFHIFNICQERALAGSSMHRRIMHSHKAEALSLGVAEQCASLRCPTNLWRKATLGRWGYLRWFSALDELENRFSITLRWSLPFLLSLHTCQDPLTGEEGLMHGCGMRQLAARFWHCKQLNWMLSGCNWGNRALKATGMGRK